MWTNVKVFYLGIMEIKIQENVNSAVLTVYSVRIMTENALNVTFSLHLMNLLEHASARLVIEFYPYPMLNNFK